MDRPPTGDPSYDWYYVLTSGSMAEPNHPDSFDAVRRAGAFLLLAILGWLLLPSVWRANDTIVRGNPDYQFALRKGQPNRHTRALL